MITSTMVDSYDTPMVDYIEDADMSMVQSTSDNWFHHHQQPSTVMEEDRAMVDEHTFQSASLEVDMITYEDTAEYEMDDAANDQDPGPVTQEIVDAEVYDASLVPSPNLPQTHDISTSTAFVVEPPAPEQVFQPVGNYDGATPIVAGLPILHNEGHEASAVSSTEHLTAEPTTNLAEPSVSSEPPVESQERPPAQVMENVIVREPPANEEPVSETYLQENASHDLVNISEQAHISLDVAAHSPHAEAGPSLEQHHPEFQEVQEVQEVQDKTTTTSHLDSQVRLEHAGQQSHSQPEHTYVDAPPILLTVHVPSLGGEQPDFALFALPGPGASTSEAGAAITHKESSEETLVLLQHRPNLFYEPISAVFEALRQEEYFSHLDDLMEAEMALNAVDLQLSISEDNIYAREVSLQDLNAMHYGIGLSGSLRLVLQSVYPRFITRYNLLRDQITRLAIADGNEEQGQTQEQQQLEEREQNVLPEIDEVKDLEVPSVTEDLAAQHAEEHGEPAVAVGEEESEPSYDSSAGNNIETVETSHDDEQRTGHDEHTGASVGRETEGASVEKGIEDASLTHELATEKAEVVANQLAQEQPVNDDEVDTGNNVSSIDQPEDEFDDVDADGEDDPDAEGELDEEQTEYHEIEQQHLEDGREGDGNEVDDDAGGPVISAGSGGLNDNDEQFQQNDDAIQGVGDEAVDGGDQEQNASAEDNIDQLVTAGADGAVTISTGNSTSSYDEDEFGEGFDDDGFEGEDGLAEEHTDHLNSNEYEASEENQLVTVSEQDTLDEFPEDRNTQYESTSEAAPITDQFGGEGEGDEDFGENDFDDHVVGDELDDPTISGTAFEDAQEPTQEDEDSLGNLSHVVHKNPSKRSLDDTEFDFADQEELSASPDSKRTRVL